MAADWPLIGRQEELLTIGRTLGDGQFRGVLLAGALGVGKTRLAREALAAAGAQGCFTGWVAASRAVAAIPFGAMAHLLPVAGDNSANLRMLQQAGEWLAAQAEGRRVVLGVDDAHMLDDASAALVFHLSVTSVAFVVATVRTGESAPGPVTAMWKDGLAERLEIQALARGDVGELIEAALDAPVDGLTRERLWQLSHGNMLYLRELVRGGRQSGDAGLRRRHLAVGRTYERSPAAGRADPGPDQRPARSRPGRWGTGGFRRTAGCGCAGSGRGICGRGGGGRAGRIAGR